MPRRPHPFALRCVLLVILLAAACASAESPAAEAPRRPNIVWIVVDDMSADFGCYGQTRIATPHVDRLAREGSRFQWAFTTAPVCSPSRSALITGRYQTSIGAHHHRSGRGELKLHLPPDTVPVPELFRRAGYYTCIGSGQGKRPSLGKTDYNFEWDKSLYDGADYAGRGPGQPFFLQWQLHGGKYREGAAWRAEAERMFGTLTDPAGVALPPYYPRDPRLLEDWARYLDAVRYTDAQVGQLLARLEADGLLDETVVFFLTDHGISHARGKQFLYDEGTRIPLVLRGPGVPRGAVREDLVEHLDVAATSLALAGIELPPSLDGRDLFAAGYQPREAVFAARDRCDETVDRLRSVRTARFKYIRNGFPGRPHLQPNAYKDHKPIVIRLRELHAAGQLDPVQELIFAPTRPAEELYDLAADPWEVRNLAGDPAYAEALAEMRGRLDAWIRQTGDQGQRPESPARYDADMAVYLGDLRKQSERRAVIEANIAEMRAWAAAGK